MTINLEGDFECTIFERSWIRKGTTTHGCCVCHTSITEKKFKVLANVACRLKQFFFCKPCYQTLKVQNVRTMNEVENRVGTGRLPDIDHVHGEMVKAGMPFRVVERTFDGIKSKVLERGNASEVDRAGLVVLGMSKEGTWVWLYHPDHGPVRVFTQNFMSCFHKVGV